MPSCNAGSAFQFNAFQGLHQNVWFTDGSDILASFPESQYPSELDNKFKNLPGGRGWFGAKLIINNYSCS